jgi:hypothetical protein
MRKLLLLLLFPLLAVAQYGVPPQGNGQAGTSFWAAGLTSQLSATSTSSVVFLSVATSSQAPSVQVYNSGTAVAFIVCGPSTVVAHTGTAGAFTADYPVAPGSVVVYTPQAGSSTCAAITSSAATIYFTPGAGL